MPCKPRGVFFVYGTVKTRLSGRENTKNIKFETHSMVFPKKNKKIHVFSLIFHKLWYYI